MNELYNILKKNKIKTSAPCRIDMGGTLDIKTLYYPLRCFSPCTFNIALDIRTDVELLAYDKPAVKISSKGFEPAEYTLQNIRFAHPLGFMFAIAAYFQAEGIHIKINSESPPKSALGGSSAAAAALISAFSKAFELAGKKPLTNEEIVFLAHQLEETAIGLTCGIQDHLAAVYGGVNLWNWNADIQKSLYSKEEIVSKHGFKELERSLLSAYCGIPHGSVNINSKWIKRFLSGQDRELWKDIIRLTRTFAYSLKNADMQKCVECVNRETEIRMMMTPDVLNETGKELARAAAEKRCGARFTGAGGGGCLWAIGEHENIAELKLVWEGILACYEGAELLRTNIDGRGLLCEQE